MIAIILTKFEHVISTHDNLEIFAFIVQRSLLVWYPDSRGIKDMCEKERHVFWAVFQSVKFDLIMFPVLEVQACSVSILIMPVSY